jgi:large subunit ribosomal protein L21
MKYAIIESGGKQYKAVEGGSIDVDRLPVQAGENVRLERVLLLADGANVIVGAPAIKGEVVWARAVAHVKGPKVDVFNYRPKKRIRVKIGHRQNYTRLLIQQVGGSELLVTQDPQAEKPAEEEAPKAREKAAPKAASSKGKAAPKKTSGKKSE